MAKCRMTSDYDPYTIDMFSLNRDLTHEAISPISPLYLFGLPSPDKSSSYDITKIR